MVDESGMGMAHHCGSNILIDSSIGVLPILHQLTHPGITQAVVDQWVIMSECNSTSTEPSAGILNPESLRSHPSDNPEIWGSDTAPKLGPRESGVPCRTASTTLHCIIFSFCLRNSRGNWNQPFQSSSINMFFSEAIPRWNPTDMRFPHHGTTPQKSGRMDADCNILTHSPGSFPDISRSKGSQIYHPTSSWWSATPPWDIRDRYHAPPTDTHP